MLRELADLTQELHRRTQGTKLFRYMPYPKQRAFHAAGAVHRERLLMAANQSERRWRARVKRRFIIHPGGLESAGIGP